MSERDIPIAASLFSDSITPLLCCCGSFLDCWRVVSCLHRKLLYIFYIICNGLLTKEVNKPLINCFIKQSHSHCKYIFLHPSQVFFPVFFHEKHLQPYHTKYRNCCYYDEYQYPYHSVNYCGVIIISSVCVGYCDGTT